MAITLKASVASGDSYVVAELGDAPADVRTSEAWIGGDKSLTFTLRGPLVNRAFEEWLALDVEESYGVVTWRGMVAQVDRVSGWVRERVSLIDSSHPVYNAIRVDYNGGTTAWGTDDASIGRYGRIEQTLSESTLTLGSAETVRDEALAAYATPVPFVVSINRRFEAVAYVEVTCVGYFTTMAWEDSTVTLGGATDIGTVISTMVSTDCPLLSVGDFDSTGVTVTNAELSGTTTWAIVGNLLKLLPNTWRAWVDVNLRAHCVNDSGAVAYRLVRDGVLSAEGRKLMPWEVHPGVFRHELGAQTTTLLAKEILRRDGEPMPEVRQVGSIDGVYYGAR